MNTGLDTSLLLIIKMICSAPVDWRSFNQSILFQLQTIVPSLVKFSPDTILVVVSNPCDVMCWVAWKISGLPRYKVIGSGTMLDSSRFRHLISERLGVASHSVHGYIIGEHGDSSVPVWSSVNIAGTRLKDVTPTAGECADKDPENWEQVY